MEGIGPDQAGKEELKRAETWRAICQELSLGVKPQWTGKSRWIPSLRGAETHSLGATPFRGLAPYPSELNRPAGAL